MRFNPLNHLAVFNPQIYLKTHNNEKTSFEWKVRVKFYSLCEDALKLENEVQNIVETGIVNLQPRMVF